MKIWDVSQPQQPITIQQVSLTIVIESRNIPAISIQDALDGVVD